MLSDKASETRGTKYFLSHKSFYWPVARKVCWERRGRGCNGQVLGQEYICWNIVIPDPAIVDPEEQMGGGEGKKDLSTFCHFSFFTGARQSLYWKTVIVSRSMAQIQTIT